MAFQGEQSADHFGMDSLTQGTLLVYFVFLVLQDTDRSAQGQQICEVGTQWSLMHKENVHTPIDQAPGHHISLSCITVLYIPLYHPHIGTTYPYVLHTYTYTYFYTPLTKMPLML